jgi:hypothetical protein
MTFVSGGLPGPDKRVMNGDTPASDINVIKFKKKLFNSKSINYLHPHTSVTPIHPLLKGSSTILSLSPISVQTTPTNGDF